MLNQAQTLSESGLRLVAFVSQTGSAPDAKLIVVDAVNSKVVTVEGISEIRELHDFTREMIREFNTQNKRQVR